MMPETSWELDMCGLIGNSNSFDFQSSIEFGTNRTAV